jgi:hypothetical protein
LICRRFDAGRAATGLQANPDMLALHMQSGRSWISLALLSSAWLTSCLISPKDYPLGLDAESNGASAGEEGDGTSGKTGNSPEGGEPNQGGTPSKAGNGSGDGSSNEGGADGSGGTADVGGTSPGGSGVGGNGGNPNGGGQGGSSGSAGSGGSGGTNPGCPGGLSVTYKPDATTASTTFLGGELQIDNLGNAIVNVENLRLRYYLTNEVTASITNAVNWAQIGPSSNRSTQVTVQFDLLPLAVPKPEADSYLEFKFQSAITLSNGYLIVFSWRSGSPGSGQNFTQTNDYSFSPSAPTDYSKLVLLEGDCVVWGTPP